MDYFAKVAIKSLCKLLWVFLGIKVFVAVLWIRDILARIRIRILVSHRTSDKLIWKRIREAQNNTDPDSEHWYIYILQKVIKKSRISRN